MLAQSYRFHGHGSLNYLHRNGKTVRNRTLGLRYVSNERREESRAVVVVSKKVVKSAVKRNRIRRRIYEVLRRHWGAIPIKKDFAITVFSADLGIVPAAEVESQVVDVLKQSGLYQPNSQSVILKDSL